MNDRSMAADILYTAADLILELIEMSQKSELEEMTALQQIKLMAAVSILKVRAMEIDNPPPPPDTVTFEIDDIPW